MKASAATIASMGAKRITMDSSAMYLVHKCSVDFFEWASANSDKLAEIIKEARQMKSDLENHLNTQKRKPESFLFQRCVRDSNPSVSESVDYL